MTAAAPSGVVKFLFTDVEGSTRRWETDAQAMRAALVVHDKVLHAVTAMSEGVSGITETLPVWAIPQCGPQ
jgi:hypothetical protein